uniref:Zinc finger protein 106 n=1 Tax=Prolemur simus TaxID=1328070 RepID=A0A8C8Z3C1_PROSS
MAAAAWLQVLPVILLLLGAQPSPLSLFGAGPAPVSAADRSRWHIPIPSLWVDDAIWRLLFSMILFVIMVLWRPSANNQRFAFSPLSEEEEEDEQKEPMLKESFEGMKMRSTKQEPNGNSKGNKAQEDDLKWVEENVPSSVTDVALPALLDSDEVSNQIMCINCGSDDFIGSHESSVH